MSIYSSFSSLAKELECNVAKYKEWLEHCTIRLNKAIIYKDKYNLSPLCAAIYCQNLDLVMWLLKAGCNKNGHLETIQSYYTPLTSIYLLNIYYYKTHGKLDKKKLFLIKQKLFDLLVLEGVDINDGGLNGKNLLALECMKPSLLIDPKWIEYLLIKGINPNQFNFISSSQILNKNSLSTFYFQPILLIYWSMIHSIMYTFGDYSNFDCLDEINIKIKWYKTKIKHITFNVLYYLVLYGANLKQIQSDNRTLHQTIEWVNKNSEFKKYDLNFNKEWKKLNRSCKDILKRHVKNDLNQFAIFFKLKGKSLANIENLILHPKKRVYIKENRKFVNTKFINCDEPITEFSPYEIVTYKDNALVWAFHISEISNLLQTKINPYTRKHIPFDIREKWYNYLDNKLIPLHYPPLCVGDLQYVTLNEPILSQGQKSITKVKNIVKFDFTHITDPQVLEIFKIFEDEPNINQLISKAVYKQQPDFVVRVFKEKKNIRITHIDSNVMVKLPQFGVYTNLFSMDLIVEKVGRIINNTSIGCYAHLGVWLNEWPFVITFKLLSLLYNFQQPIFTADNWQLVLSIWDKRKNTRRIFMKKYFIDMLISILYNGFINNTLDITLFIGCIIQLHNEYLFTKKIQQLVWEFYKNKILTSYDDIENSDNYFFGKIKNDYNELFLAIINLFHTDIHIKDLFSINITHLIITLHKSPGLAYFKTTNTKDLKWDAMSDEEKLPFIKSGKDIKKTTVKGINKIWGSMQDLLYLINNEEFHDPFLIL